ncbi:MAG: polymer-forming cytoskeletal protein [Chloroflexota bacterium]
MKRASLAVVLALIALFALPLSALAAGPQDGQVILGETFTLGTGQTVEGDLVVIGGVVTLEQGSRVTGDVVLFGGTLSSDGEIDGNLAAFGGTVSLGAHAVVRGDLVRFGAVVHKEAGATILGQEVWGQAFEVPSIEIPRVGGLFPFRLWSFRFEPLGDVLVLLLKSLVMGALAVLVVMFWPDATARVARGVVEYPVVAGGLGLLSLIVVPAILVILIVSLCLSPVGIVGFVLLGVAAAYGVIGAGLEVGLRLEQAFKVDMHPAAAAGVGTLVLVLVTGSIGLIPCVGWIAPLVLASLAVGGVILTRFGTRFYTPAAPPSQPGLTSSS